MVSIERTCASEGRLAEQATLQELLFRVVAVLFAVRGRSESDRYAIFRINLNVRRSAPVRIKSLSGGEWNTGINGDLIWLFGALTADLW